MTTDRQPPTVRPTRPLLRYHGGKWLLADWIISHFPTHRTYTEPFGGAGSVLLQKPRTYAEVYNDLDSEIVNLFRVLRTRGAELRELLRLTPFARAEFRQSFKPTKDELEQARRTVVRSFMGFGSNAHCKKTQTGFRSNSNRSGTTPALDWKNYPDALEAIIERLRGVVIENRDALEVIEQHDGPTTLHYLDPPYVHATRTRYAGAGARAGYNHEMSDAQHRALIEVARRCKGMVILSGYSCALYDEGILSDWPHLEHGTFADGARPRVERLWFNASAWARRPQAGFTW